LITIGVNNATLSNFNKIFQNGQVKINLLMNLFKKHN
jgi:hypothetical protein